MSQLPQPGGRSFRQLANCLNRAFGELNVFLLAIAIGLAALNLTCFAALKISAELTRASAVAGTTSAGPLVAGGVIGPGMKMRAVPP